MINSEKINSSAIRFCIIDGDAEVGRAFLYLIKNDLNDRPYALL